MTLTNRPHLRYEHVYALVRIDLPVSEAAPQDTVAVVKVLCSEESARREAARLNQINRDKGCRYFVYTCRLIPESAGE